MASYSHSRPPPAPSAQPGARDGHGQPPSHAHTPRPVQMAPPGSAPAGTFQPGTKIQVGNHRVVIQKYLSEGGFAHVYLVKMRQEVDGTDLAVLKRVAVPDKEALRGMRIEVETMKRLKGHRHIVTYIDSHASELRSGGYEVFLLMEYCNGGGLIDFMNTRLQHRLTEPEILRIFADVAEGVACMHYLQPPLLHRDLKVENVLITLAPSATGPAAVVGGRNFKLCDFGSAAPPRPAPTTVAECHKTNEDVQKHTTVQYRSPEMIDVYRKLPIDEKSDIWALGVMLYKLCYYTTPFEGQGQLAILNASFQFPTYPVFSDQLKRLIGSMLRENQRQRPNIYQALQEACAMQKLPVPIKDIYSGRSHSQPGGNSEAVPAKPSLAVGAVLSTSAQPAPQQIIPDVERMRRGRVPAQSTPSTNPASLRTSASVPSTVRSPRITTGDPFAALDAKATGMAAGNPVDELSSRFPTIDQFTILHNQGTRFDFISAPSPPPQEQSPSPPPSKQQQQQQQQQQKQRDLSQRVTERLADEAFASPLPPSAPPSSKPATLKPALPTGSRRFFPDVRGAKPYTTTRSPSNESPAMLPPPRATEVSRASAIISSLPELQAISSQQNQHLEPAVIASKPPPKMVSTGTMTSPRPDKSLSPSSSSSDSSNNRNSTPTGLPSRRHDHQHASSLRPSLENRRPCTDVLASIHKSKSATSVKPRPPSGTHLESNLDFLRMKEDSGSESHSHSQPRHLDKESPPVISHKSGGETATIHSSVEFLRTMEDSEPSKSHHHHHHHHRHSKRKSLSSLGAETKNIITGKFGTAFKRFEGGHLGSNGDEPQARTPSPQKQLLARELTPIAGSVDTGDLNDDYRNPEPSDDDMTAEERRELERHHQQMEEERVARRQDEYKQRLAQQEQQDRKAAGADGPGASASNQSRTTRRSGSIQDRVKTYLSETTRVATTISRTAQGYGHHSDSSSPASDTKKPASCSERRLLKPLAPHVLGGAQMGSSASGATKPVAPPKPMHLNLTGTSGVNVAKNTQARISTAIGCETTNTTKTTTPRPLGSSSIAILPGRPTGAPTPSPRSESPPKAPALPSSIINVSKTRVARMPVPAPGGGGRGGAVPPRTGEREVLIAVDLPGQPAVEMTAAERDDCLGNFQQRFPSLSSLEMVERDLSEGGAQK